MSSGVYYNENDKRIAAWLRELIARGHLPAGDVDERDIRDVQPDDVRGYRHAHFFAGIGGWPLALQLAGWPADRSVWTGSCPCQPFSVAGSRRAHDDERHLWPAWFRLIEECRPQLVIGEQVTGAISLGWLDAVSTDMESRGYACGAAVLPAASVGAPHIRSRLWWMAYASADRVRQHARVLPEHEGEREERAAHGDHVAEACGDGGGLADADSPRPSRAAPRARRAIRIWQAAQWIECADGVSRPIEPGVAPLAHGVPVRVVRLRGYGNAIVPQVAAAFVEAVMEVLP